MKKKSIIKNYMYNLSYQLLRIILPIITTPYVSRVLGAENLGIYGYTLSISAYFILFGSLGIAMYGQREIAYFQEDRQAYTKSFWEIVIFRIITMSISLLIFGLIFITHNQYSMYYKILILEILGNCLDISWFFQGHEDFKRTVFRNLLVKIISVICIFIFIKTKNDLIKYFWIYVLSILIGNVSLWFYLPKYIVKIHYKKINIWRHFRPTLALFIPQIAVEIYTLLDKTMIGIVISNKSEVGYYEQAQKIIRILLTLTTSLGTVMMPRIANTFVKGENEKVKKYMLKSFNIVYLLAFPLIFGIIVVAKNFVPVFFGSGYDRVIILMQTISPIILLIGLSNVTGMQYLLPTKRQKEYTISVICGAIVNFFMNSLMIWRWGALGASLGTIIAEFTVTLVQLIFVRRDFNISDILILSKNYVIAGLIMFMCCFLVNLIDVTNIVNIIVKIIVGFITYSIALILMKDKLVTELINKVLKREELI